MDISNKGGVRSCKKLLKFDDYEFEDFVEFLIFGKLLIKKVKKVIIEILFDICINEFDEELEFFDFEVEINVVMKNWIKKVFL